MPKLFPSSRMPSISRGTEIHSDITETGIFVIKEHMMDRPVIPPGASPVDWNTQLTANAVRSAEMVMLI